MTRLLRSPALRLALLGLVATVVAAEEPLLPGYTAPEMPSLAPSAGLLLLRTIGSLGLVLGLIAATAWLYKTRGGLAAVPATGRLRLLETLGLGTGRTIYLVAVGDQVLLLGGGAELTCLASYDAAAVGYDSSREPVGVESFLARFTAAREAVGEPFQASG